MWVAKWRTELDCLLCFLFFKMWERQISAILLLFYFCTFFSHGETNSVKSYVEGLTLESKQNIENVFYQAGKYTFKLPHCI